MWKKKLTIKIDDDKKAERECVFHKKKGEHAHCRFSAQPAEVINLWRISQARHSFPFFLVCCCRSFLEILLILVCSVCCLSGHFHLFPSDKKLLFLWNFRELSYRFRWASCLQGSAGWHKKRITKIITDHRICQTSNLPVICKNPSLINQERGRAIMDNLWNSILIKWGKNIIQIWVEIVIIIMRCSQENWWVLIWHLCNFQHAIIFDASQDVLIGRL